MSTATLDYIHKKHHVPAVSHVCLEVKKVFKSDMWQLERCSNTHVKCHACGKEIPCTKAEAGEE